MSRALMLLILGILVMLAPFSGLPMSILAWILPVLGALVLAIGVSYKRERRTRPEPIAHEPSLSIPA